MTRTLGVALRLAVVTLVLTGLVYPLVMTGLAQAMFRSRSQGSLLNDERGRIVGSALIGQVFRDPGYFHARPSAAGSGYDATRSSGANLGPTSSRLRDRMAADRARLRAENPDARRPVPADLVTASASGLDPHLSPAGAIWQAARVARARGVAEGRILALIAARIEPRQLGFLGEPRVNVLLLNLDLDRELGRPAPGAAPGVGECRKTSDPIPMPC